MATTYYFIESPHRQSAVLDWLRNQNIPPLEVAKDGYAHFYFREAGRLGETAKGEIDVSASPLVTVVPPKVHRGVLWTVGEVRFLAKNAPRELPIFESIRRRFERWLWTYPTIFEQRGPQGEFDYFLEGGIQNVAPKVFALPSGLEAIQAGQYFVLDGPGTYDDLCRTLRLRGVNCV